MVNIDAVLQEIALIEAKLKAAENHDFKEAHEQLLLLCKELLKAKIEYKHIDCDYPKSLTIRLQFVDTDHTISDETVIKNTFLEQRKKLFIDDLSMLNRLKKIYEMKKRLGT